MDLLPAQINGVIYFNIVDLCNNAKADCKSCSDIGGALHNWLLINELHYVIIDFQDEKDICHTFIIEILQLRKRLQIPFLFVGVTDNTKKVLEDYYYFKATSFPTFATPQESSEFLTQHFPNLIHVDISSIKFSEKVGSISPRHSLRGGDYDDEEEDSLPEEYAIDEESSDNEDDDF